MEQATVQYFDDKFLAWEEFDFDSQSWLYLFSILPNAAAVFDENLCYLAVSDQWNKAYRHDNSDIIGMNHYDDFPDLPDRWKELHKKALKGRASKCDNDPFPREDGSLDWVSWELTPLKDKSGKVRGMILFTEVVPQLI